MSVTSNYQLTLLEVGQKEKEVTINTNFNTLDQKVIKYLGELTSDPAAGPVAGSLYFNTSSNKMKVLKSNGSWVAIDGSAISAPEWAAILNKPTTLAGYQIETEVNSKIAAKTAFTNLSVGNEFLIDGSAKIALETSGVYGWQDLVAPFTVKAVVGSNNPNWGTLFNGLQGYTFDPTTMNQVWVDFHIVHDIALGTVLYPHVHWMPTTTGTGTVRWGFEYSVAKGHQQGADSVFPATTTVYVTQTISSASQWMHFVAEVSQADAIPATNIEPDSVIKMRVFRDATNDTYAGNVHAWQADIHYQVNTLSTKNKSPNFYA